MFSGPLPPPDILTAYNDAFAGCAERIVVMAEKQSAHRQQMENEELRATIRLADRGQIIAGSIGVLALLGGMTLVMMDRSLAGFTIIAGDAIALGGAFIYGQYQSRREATESSEPAKEQPQLPSKSSGDQDRTLTDV